MEILFNSFMTEAVDWFLYDNGLCHERVKRSKGTSNIITNWKTAVFTTQSEKKKKKNTKLIEYLHHFVY